MFGQLASSQTVTSRFSRSLALRLATALPDGILTRIQDGLRSTGASANCTGERAILSPDTWRAPGSRLAVSPTTVSGMVRVGESFTSGPAKLRDPHERRTGSCRPCGLWFEARGGGLDRQAEAAGDVFEQHRL